MRPIGVPIASATFTVARAGFAALVAALVVAAPHGARADEKVWALMKMPGHIVLLRHSYAPESPPDTDLVNLKNCKTQRNLDETGRAHARRLGDEFRKHGIKRAVIHSSQYCRTLETARLLKLGPVKELPALNQTFFAKPGEMREAATKTIAFMKTLPAKQLAVLVTHVTNIQAVAGVMVASGELAVVRFGPSGDVVADGRIKLP
ncbi:MAG: histidine phosphatase family protein [Alphaproteobacteria bacterium]|nr:histidine phosphatase family protein [Alphaproteobacteria bacterium]